MSLNGSDEAPSGMGHLSKLEKDITMFLDVFVPFESIRGLLITNENYSIAFKILRERYANKQVLISSCMESFVKLQPTTSMKNVSGLRAMYDLVQGNVHHLSSLGVPCDAYGKLFLLNLTTKFGT